MNSSTSSLHVAMIDQAIMTDPPRRDFHHPEYHELQEDARMLKLRNEDLKTEIIKLQREHDQTYEHYAIDTRELKRRYEMKDEECKQLLKKIDETNEAADEKIKDIIQKKNDEIDSFKDKLFVQETDFKRKSDKLMAELTVLRDFNVFMKKREREYQDAIKKLTADLEKSRIERNEAVSKMHNERAKALALENEREVSKNRLTTRSDLDKSMNFSRARTPVNHHKGHQEENGYNIFERTSILTADPPIKRDSVLPAKHREKGDHEKSKDISHLNISVEENELLNYQSLNLKLSNKIKHLKTKNQQLETALEQITSSHQKEIEKLQYHLMSKIKNFEVEVQKYKDENIILRKEIRNLKSLSQMILAQRSEIEEFLIEAINHVKSNMKKDQINLMNQTNRSRLPGIGSRPDTGGINRKVTPGKASDKTDLIDLNWEEKEKILRILFSKINGSQNSKKWKENMFNADFMNSFLDDKTAVT